MGEIQEEYTDAFVRGKKNNMETVPFSWGQRHAFTFMEVDTLKSLLRAREGWKSCLESISLTL